MKTNNKHLKLGLVMIMISFGYWFLPISHKVLLVANALFVLGNIFIFDYLSERFSGYSLLKVHHRRKHFLILGFLVGLFLELYINWIGKFWYFPYWDEAFYIISFVPGWALYSLYLLETYLGVKAIIEKLFFKSRFRESFAGLRLIFISAGMLGAAMLSTGTLYLALSLTKREWQEALIINQTRQSNPHNWYWYFIIVIGFWLILECFEYYRHETSLLYEIFKGNYWPLLAIIVASLAGAISYEVFNLPGGLWRYSYENVPFAQLRFIGFPVMMFIAWPFHYLPVISLYRILYKNDTKKLWQ